jgi:hypothetical protein
MSNAAQVDRLHYLIQKARHVPDETRRFAVTATAARTTHRLDLSQLTDLVEAGLPSVGPADGQPDQRLFDDYDLGNIALHLGLPSVRRRAIRSWTNALRRADERASQPDIARARVGFVPRCPVAGHDGPCRYSVLGPDGRRQIHEGTQNGTDPVTAIDLDLPCAWPDVGPRAQALIEELADVDFFILPEVIRWDPALISTARIADCGGAAEWLVAEGRRRGLEARFSFGLLVARPYSTPHCWAEFRTDGVWVPVDPLLIGVMRSLGLESWPLHHSIGPITSRLCGRFTKLVEHDGVWTPLSLPTQWLS